MTRFENFTDKELDILISYKYYIYRQAEPESIQDLMQKEMSLESDKRHKKRIAELKKNEIKCVCCNSKIGYKIQPQRPFGL